MRWRHLTDPVQPIGLRPLFRATAVGFMANNIFPLRVGEVIRPWYLSREVGAPPAALFGTVILERVIDTIMVIGLAAIAIALRGAGEGGILAQCCDCTDSGRHSAADRARCAAGGAPSRHRPRGWFLRPFPARFGNYLIDVLGRFGDGLGALKGGAHLFWIGFHSIVVWFVVSTIPMLAGFWALGIDFGSPFETLVAAWITLAAVGMAVAIPSAPGFFGTYHAACKLALEPLAWPLKSRWRSARCSTASSGSPSRCSGSRSCAPATPPGGNSNRPPRLPKAPPQEPTSSKAPLA